MRFPVRSLPLRAMLVLLGAAFCLLARADYPDRPLRLVMPYGAGSGPDVATRPLAEAMAKELGQAVVVDNRPSAGGVVGMQQIAMAAPDGYTIGFGNVITLAVNRSFYSRLPYDPEKDFTPVSLALGNAYVLIARRDFPANNVQALVAYARSRPGQVNMASGTGIGSGGHLAGELLKARSGTFMLHVPYRTGAQAIADIVNGQVDIMFDNVSGVQQFIRNGTVKALAVTSRERLPLLPDVPTVSESGYPGFEAMAWGGIVAPAGTPKPIVDRLNAAVAAAMKAPAVVRSNATLAVDPMPSTPEAFRSFVGTEVVKWAEIVRRSGAKAD